MRMYKWLAVLLLPLLAAGVVPLSGCDDEPAFPPPPEEPPTAPQDHPPPPGDFDDPGQENAPDFDF